MPASPEPDSTDQLRALLTEHLDDWAEIANCPTAEHQIDGWRSALDLADTLTELNRIATELGVHP